MKTASDLIALWPSAEHFSSDLGLKYPSYGRVMKMRGRIPERYWPAMLDAAKRRDIAVSHDDLIAAHPAKEADAPQTDVVAA